MHHRIPIVIVAGLSLLAATRAQADSDAAPTSRPERMAALTRAVNAIKAEAGELEVWQRKPEHPAVFKRPHPALAANNITPAMAVDVLRRMGRRFTGNDYRDSYIRWHLMHVVKEAGATDREHMGPMLVSLVNEMPGPIETERKKEYSHEPLKVYREWRRLHHSVRARVGYPPFQETVYGRKALRHLSGGEKARARAVLAKAAKLREKWKRTRNPHAIAYNRRIRQVNYILRQYRGELIYLMLRTGDPKMLDIIADAMGKQLRRKNHIAFDLMAYCYQAAFDGHFGQYDDASLEKFQKQLENLGRANEQYMTFYGHVRRNFADYAFHMTQTLKEGQRFVKTESFSEEIPTDDPEEAAP